MSTFSFKPVRVSKLLAIIHVALSLWYLYAIVFWFPRGHMVLFAFLVIGEVFHVWQALTYIYTIWNTAPVKPLAPHTVLSEVDVYITVTGEPAEIIEKTVRAALAMDYPHFSVFLLNDGYVAKKENWREAEQIAQHYGIKCITRRIPGGAKAGNINHALSVTTAPFIAVLDADHIPHPDFLSRLMPYFSDPNMGFVQSPQYYKNHELNYVSAGSWEQQQLFFGPICQGKNRLNAAFMCGTNMILRKQALVDAGGMADNIAEDFVTSVFIHERGWRSAYIPDVLAEGLAPEDFLSYYKQQHRWARGSLEVIFRHNPLFKRGLSFGQKIQYLASASYYLSGVIVFLNALFPLVFFFTGASPLSVSTMTLAALFLPYIFLTIYILRTTSNYSYSFRALSFSVASWSIHLRALWNVLTGAKTSFAVTSKKQLSGNFAYLTWPHMLYIMTAIAGMFYALWQFGPTAAVVTNICWALFNISLFIPFVFASLPQATAKSFTVRPLYQVPAQSS